MSLHRHIAIGKMREAARNLEAMKMQLQQRDAVLFALIKKHGPQTITFDELAEFTGADSAIICRPDQEAQTVTFEAVDSATAVIDAANEIAREGGEHFVSGEEPVPMNVKFFEQPETTEQETTDATQSGQEQQNSVEEHQGDDGRTPAREDGPEARGENGAQDGCGRGDAEAGRVDDVDSAPEVDVK